MAAQYRCRRPWLWRGIAALIATSAGALPLAGPAHAEAKKSAVLVVDGNTGRVLHQSAADELRHPASLAKMMTIYIAFELIEQGRLSYQTKIKFSANAVAATPSKLDLEEGEEIALIDAIKILITKSANDVAIAVAEHIAGSEEKFARLMTRKAHQLGMTATTFRNASGLPDDAQVTTARDMVTLALRLQDDFPKHYPLFATRTATYKDEIFRNHNTLLLHYEGTDGLKTGYTRASGFNLVASVRRGKKHVIGAVFGGASAASRNSAMRTFLNMGLVKASNEKTRQPAAALIAQAPRPAAGQRIASVPTPKRVPRPPEKSLAAASPPPAATPPAEPAATQLRTAISTGRRDRARAFGPGRTALGRSGRPTGPGAARPADGGTRSSVADAAMDHGRQPRSGHAPRRTIGQTGPVLGYHHCPGSTSLDLRATGLQACAWRATGCTGDDRGAASPGARPHQGAGGCGTARTRDDGARRLPDPDRGVPERGRGRAPAGRGARARGRSPGSGHPRDIAGPAGAEVVLSCALFGLRRAGGHQDLRRAQAAQDRLPGREGGVAAGLI